MTMTDEKTKQKAMEAVADIMGNLQPNTYLCFNYKFCDLYWD